MPYLDPLESPYKMLIFSSSFATHLQLVWSKSMSLHFFVINHLSLAKQKQRLSGYLWVIKKLKGQRALICAMLDILCPFELKNLGRTNPKNVAVELE